MDKILYIDSTARENSRTRVLSNHLLSKLDGSVTHLYLYDEDLPTLCGETLMHRSECAAKKDFSDARFRFAKQFAEADEIVIAAPYWDNSFPAILKKYIETISVCNLTFEYTPDGRAIGLCAAKKLYYVTTSGGYVSYIYGYGYISELAKTMYGIPETFLFKAEGLDIAGADVDAILSEAKRKIDRIV